MRDPNERPRTTIAAGLIAFFALGLSGPATSGQEGPQGLRYWTELAVGGRIGSVPVRLGYAFCRGDAAALVFETDADVQVMALTRASAGGDLDAREGGGAQWKVVSKTGGIEAKSLPRGQRMKVLANLDELAEDESRMDVLLVVAPPDADLASHFVPEKSAAEIDLWRRNTVQERDRSRRENHAFAVDPAAPAVIELTLETTPCERRLSLEPFDAHP